MKEKMAIPDELLSKISGAGDELNDQDKETLGALASMIKASGMSYEECEEFFKKQYPMHWEGFVAYIKTVWETL